MAENRIEGSGKRHWATAALLFGAAAMIEGLTRSMVALKIFMLAAIVTMTRRPIREVAGDRLREEADMWNILRFEVRHSRLPRKGIAEPGLDSVAGN